MLGVIKCKYAIKQLKKKNQLDSNSFFVDFKVCHAFAVFSNMF